jgi:hypothetical protein
MLGADYTFWRTSKETGERDRTATVGAKLNTLPQEQLMAEQQ